MKKVLFTLAVALLIPVTLAAQADKIKGVYYTAEKSSTVEIKLHTNGKYIGVINWLEEPNENGKPKVDDQNPDAKLQTRPLLGLKILKAFEYNSKKKQWVNGKIYDPDNGKTYACYAWFEDGNYDVLYLKGYVAGIRALGRETTWTRKE